MNDNAKENFKIAEDGTIMRSYNELDTAMLNIIRIGASKDDILAAYKARKICYQLCKESAELPDYKEYVETLLLDNFPNELKKADYGKQYVNLRRLRILCIIVGILCLWIGLVAIDDDSFGLGLLCFAVDAGMYYIVTKFLVKKLSNISQTIRRVKYNY